MKHILEVNPLILTLELDPEAFDFFSELRDKHFPPERNFLKAHLTLFHQLPKAPFIANTLAALAQQQAPLSLRVADLMFFGRGVAYKLESDELQQLHRYLQKQYHRFLIAQDRQKLRPHITIQNKVTPQEARELESSLRQSFTPFEIQGSGFQLWEYQGGPWAPYQSFPFSAEPPGPANLQ